MKKTLLILVICCISNLSNGQTLLASFDLELKKSSDHHQALSFSNKETNEVYVVVSDKENVTAMHYNSAVFFKDSLKSLTPDKETPWLSGYSFNENNTPVVLWAAENYKKIRTCSFDFKTRKIAEKEYNFTFTAEMLLNVFSENNTFYILTKVEEKDQLKLYLFKNDSMSERTIDLSEVKFYDDKNRPMALGKLLEMYPLERMETKALNPLFFATRKSKFYVFEKNIVFTFDHAVTQTQLVDISLDSFTVSSKSVDKPSLSESAANSNSFLQDGHLFQIKSNPDELVVTVHDLISGAVLQSFQSKHDDITFRNSPLFAQTGNQRPKELKNTKKFLNRLDGSQTGISVYNQRGDYLVTIGGQRNVATTGDVFLGVSVGVAGAVTGTGIELGELFDSPSTQIVYFETHMDPNGNYLKKQQEALASDRISQFLYENRSAVLSNSFPFMDYYILGYYDKKEEKYVLRKFEDF